jgi:hypothetical protein
MGEAFFCCAYAQDKAGEPTWDDGNRWCTVTVVSPHAVSHARERPVKRHVQLTSGPRLHFIISKIFNHLNFKIRIGDLPDIQNSPNFAGR